ncbi:Tc toxin subunit A [Enterobacter mori]|uniref:Tc toxin subunit A n=1 Tax=Enterobacter mori TaxID=539813 RepID=UPI001B8D1FEF|nr:Tc toxin subunit A [Enterobacter mori]MBS3049632.1 hypothetical protein [Enterobacter mori]
MDIEKGKSFISQLVEQVAPGLRDKLSPTRSELSVMNLLKQGPDSLLRDNPKLNYPQAKLLHQRFEVVVRTLVRHRRELRQQGSPPRPQERKGLEAFTLPLTYESQFTPNWAQNTLPDAIDSSHGPVAYLIDLLLFLEEVIEPLANDKKAIFLRQRRPDIYQMLLDEESVQAVISKIKIINQILETAIRKHTGESDLDKLLRNVRFPYRFPFEYYTHQIHMVLHEHELSLGDIKRDCSQDAPYFTQIGLYGQGSDAAIVLDSGLGPQLRTILLASSNFGDQMGFADPLSKKRLPQKGSAAAMAVQTDYFRQNFGVVQFTDLLNVTVFCQQLKLERNDLEMLLSRGEELSRLSPNVTDVIYLRRTGEEGRLVEPNVYGSVFINAGAAPAINVRNGVDGEYHRFVGLSESRCERIERFLRLAQALDLSYEQLDILLVAIMRAEQHGAEQENASAQWNITNNTLRGLGLFVQLKRHFKCTVEQCCVLFDGISLYSRGKGISYFDQLFNRDERVMYRLVLDGNSLEERDINHICSVFGINYDTFAYLALVVRQVLNLETLTRSREVISALYRPVVLAELLNIKPLELLALLKTMNPDAQFERELLGIPENRVYQAYDRADIVSIVHALISVHRWSKENKLSVAQVFNWITPSIVVDREDQTELRLFDDLKMRIPDELFTNKALLASGVPDAADWVSELSKLVNTQGIVRESEHGFDSQGYKAGAQQEIDRVVEDKLKAEPADKRLQISQSILAVLLEKRTAQWKSVSGVLEAYLGSKTDNIAPALYWSGSSTEALLTLVREEDKDTELMQLLSGVRRYEQIIMHFRLEPAMMAQLLSYDHLAWYGLPLAEPSLLTLYRISQYRQMVDESKQEAEKLFNYLELVNALPNEGDEDAVRLYRDQMLNKLSLFFGWSVNELLTVAQYLSPENAIIRDLPQLLIAKRIHTICLRTGLSARSVISIADLNEISGPQEHQRAAEQVLESLVQKASRFYSNDESSQGDLTASVAASGTLLVANNETGDQVVLTLTLCALDNRPLVGVPVRWEKTTAPGELVASQAETDSNGRVTATLEAGTEQGIALVKAYYGVKAIALPAVRIDSDTENLGIYASATEPEDITAIPADGKTRVKITTWLADTLGNNGLDKEMRWEIAGGRFAYVQNITDKEGASVAEVVSDAPGSAVVKVNYAHSADPDTEVTITFVQPN